MRACRLMDPGIAHIVRNTFHSSLDMSCGVLVGLGPSESGGLCMMDTFRDVHERRLIARREVADGPERMAREAGHRSREPEGPFARDERDFL